MEMNFKNYWKHFFIIRMLLQAFKKEMGRLSRLSISFYFLKGRPSRNRRK
jgi:hypothetical protein